MKKLVAEEGLKINPSYLLNKIGDINETNWREAVNNLFTPGLFISRKLDGSLDSQFTVKATNPYTPGGSDYQSIEVGIAESGLPAQAYTSTGKLISLYAAFTVTPFSVLQNESQSLVSGKYILYLKPNVIGVEQASYLPNYTVGTNTKDLVQEYMADFTVARESARVLNEYIPIASFTLTVTDHGVISSLLSLRESYRAYLNRELYDWFSADFLRHMPVLAPATYNVGQHLGYIDYSTGEVLSGTISLFSNKVPNSRIDVIFDGTTNFPAITFPDSTNTYVLYITLSNADYANSGVISKILEYENATTFTPTVDKIVVGVRSRNSVPSGLPPVEE